jgi:4-hydroxymandelate oxidase
VNELINLFDFERVAIERLPAGARDYFRGGAHDELTLRDNHAAFERWQIHYRVLRNVAQRELATELFGHRIEWPVLVAPTACHQLAHPEGELATARAAAAVGTAMVLSTISNFAMEDVAREARRGLWFQLYVYRDRGITSDLVARAVDCGCQAIALTVDAPVGGVRERDLRNAFAFPSELPLRNVLPSGSEAVVPDVPVSFQQYVNSMFDPSLGWSDLEWLCSRTKLPVLIKGVVRPDDAVRAAEHGARGVIVSNHGGRQLDTAPAALDVLESIVQAVGERLTVLADGGVRRGTDVLKALALGARAVLVGRPVLWGLAVDGEAGARRVLELLRNELDVAMALSGCRTIAEIDRDLVRRA